MLAAVLLSASLGVVSLEFRNDDWPVERSDPHGDDHLTCAARLRVGERNGWSVVAEYRILTDKWREPYHRADEGSLEVLSPWGLGAGALLVGDLGGNRIQNGCHEAAGEPDAYGIYEPAFDLRPMVTCRRRDPWFWCDVMWWGDGYRAALGPSLAWEGGPWRLRLDAGVGLTGGDQLSEAAEAWRDNGPPVLARASMAYGWATASLEWSCGQVLGGIGVEF